MKILETGFEMVQTIRKEGVVGLWEHLKDQFADLKETVMDAIMGIIENQVIQAGIKWIMGLLTPVGAFVKAAMAIIDVVKFFIQRAAQIMELVKAFTESVAAIASGKVGAVAKAIENALGKSIPVLIGFLASLLGIGGLADKVIGVIKKIRQRIVNAITKFWNFIKVKAGKLLSKIGISKKDNKEKINNEEDPLFYKLNKYKEPVQKEGGHNFKLEGNAVSYEYSVYSKKKSLDDILEDNEKRHPNDQVKKNAIRVIKSKKIKIDKLIDDYQNVLKNIYKKGGTPTSEKEYNAIRSEMKLLVEALEKLDLNLGGTGIVESNITFTLENDKARKVVAKPLTKVPGNTYGSSPKSPPPGWEKIHPQERSSYWVRAHMLNHEFHGQGENYNLFPATKKMNTSDMLNKVESPAKNLLKEGKVLHYEVEITNYHSGVYNEFPQSISMKFGEYDPEKKVEINEKSFKFTQDKPNCNLPLLRHTQK